MSAISHPKNVLNGQIRIQTIKLVNVIVITVVQEDAIGLELGTLTHANVSKIILATIEIQSLVRTMNSLTMTLVSAKHYRNVIGRNAIIFTSLILRVKIVNVLSCAIVKITSLRKPLLRVKILKCVLIQVILRKLLSGKIHAIVILKYGKMNAIQSMEDYGRAILIARIANYTESQKCTKDSLQEICYSISIAIFLPMLPISLRWQQL